MAHTARYAIAQGGPVAGSAGPGVLVVSSVTSMHGWNIQTSRTARLRPDLVPSADTDPPGEIGQGAQAESACGWPCRWRNLYTSQRPPGKSAKGEGVTRPASRSRINWEDPAYREDLVPRTLSRYGHRLYLGNARAQFWPPLSRMPRKPRPPLNSSQPAPGKRPRCSIVVVVATSMLHRCRQARGQDGAGGRARGAGGACEPREAGDIPARANRAASLDKPAPQVLRQPPGGSGSSR